VARKGDGSLRDAQSIFDQVISLCGENVTHAQILQALNLVDTEIFFRVTDLIKKRDAQGGLALVDELMNQGHDIKDFLAGLIEHFRNLLVAKTTGSTQLIEASDLYRKRYAAEAEAFTVADLLRLQKLVGGTEAAVRWSAQPRFKLEADIVQMITMHRAPEIAELLAQVEELKKKLGEDRTTVTRHISTQTHTGSITSPPVPASSPVRAEPVGAAVKLAEGEIASRWQEFIGEVRSKRISLGSVLASTTLLGVNGTSIRVGCSNDFEASTVTRNREVLADITQKLFGVRARLDAEIQTGLQSNAGTGAESGQAGGPNPGQEHPVIQAIIKELGAEPM
jgi:DNA polymerase III gamma/tau subunit